MARVQFNDVQTRPTEFLDVTSWTRDELQQRVPAFEAAFHAPMAVWRLDGNPRAARQFAVYQNCLLPTPDDRLFFLLPYLKTYTLQVVQGRLFGMRQSKANQWIHVRLPALLAALRTRGDAPTRALTALAQRRGVTDTAAAAVVTPRAKAPAPAPAPLLPMTAPSAASSAPKTLRNRRGVRAASKRTTRCKMFGWAMRRSRSCFCVRRRAAGGMIGASRRLLPTRFRLGASGYRPSASWRLRCPPWRSSCRRRNPGARS